MPDANTFTVKIAKTTNWLVVPTRLKNISQNGNLSQVGVGKKYLKPPPSKVNSRNIPGTPNSRTPIPILLPYHSHNNPFGSMERRYGKLPSIIRVSLENP